MKKTNLLSMAALALMMVTACNKNEIEQIIPTTQQSSEADGITITAQLAPKTPLTRALVDKGNKMEATWAKDEHLFYIHARKGDIYNLPLGVLWSAGFGLRWVTPMAPLSFEWGFPLTPRPGDPKFQFEFNIKNSF